MIGMFDLYKVMRNSNVDFWGLGQWCSFVVWLSLTHKTWVVVAYSPGKGKPQGLSTVDQHTLTYLQKKDMYGVNPRRLFDLDSHAVLRMLKSKGKRLLVVMDLNKYIIIGKFM